VNVIPALYRWTPTVSGTARYSDVAQFGEQLQAEPEPEPGRLVVVGELPYLGMLAPVILPEKRTAPTFTGCGKLVVRVAGNRYSRMRETGSQACGKQVLRSSLTVTTCTAV
jgi:phosphohistidine phosphatase SixA